MSSAIETRGLTRRFGSLVAVQAVDYQVPAGSISGLIGPNGAGKTTLMSMLAGFLRPSEGEGKLMGLPLASAGLRGRFAMLPQDARFPPQRRTLDLLAFWGELSGLASLEAQASARRALEAVGLSEKAGARAGTLSHGQAKRLGLAQTLLGSPELILLDEPTSGLDPRSAHEVRQLIGAMRGRATVVISSHNLAELQSLCDHATILSRGKIVAAGPVEALTQADQEVFLVVSGRVDLEALRALEAVAEAELVHDESLRVRFGSARVSLDQGTAAVLRHLLDRGHGIVSLSRGRSLEQRFLELT
jgi:ABC-type multidrug transport system ATPase subunit